MADDYPAKPLSNREVRSFAKRLRGYFGVAGERRVDVLSCAAKRKIWTIKGERRLDFQVLPDGNLGGDYGLTTYGQNTVTISIRQSVSTDALMGVGRARNTIAHEFGHAVMHDGPPMARRVLGNITPRWLKPFESAEHQAKVFAAAFLINDAIEDMPHTADEISIEFGISVESANIYLDKLVKERNRERDAERMLRIAADFRAATMPAPAKIPYLSAICPICSHQTIFPVGVKFLCQTCETIFDRFQDGDPDV